MSRRSRRGSARGTSSKLAAALAKKSRSLIKCVFSTPVAHFLKHHIPKHATPFSPTITRDFRPPKPSPAGILHIAHAWGITNSPSVPSTPRWERLLPLLMVGDSIDDIEAGYEAGALTVFLRSPGKEAVEEDERTDVAISRLDELIEILKNGIESQRPVSQQDGT